MIFRKIKFVLILSILCIAGGDFTGLLGWKRIELPNKATLYMNSKLPDFDLKKHCNMQGTETLPEQQGWYTYKTSIDQVNVLLGVNLDDLVLEKAKDDDKVVILDWGPGSGRAVRELAKYCHRNEIDNTSFYGFGNLYFPEWGQQYNRINWIFDEAENLHRYFRYKEIDIIYSHLGLAHLKAKDFVKHIKSLIPYLSEGALIITDHTRRQHEAIMELYPYFDIDSHKTNMRYVLVLKRNSVGSVFTIKAERVK